MFDLIFELVIQFLFEAIGEFLFEAGFRATARVLRSRVVRYTLAALGGFVFGVWWGDHLSAPGREHGPRLFWVSVALAVVFAVAAVLRRRSREPGHPGLVDLFTPWRWPDYRFIGLAVLNAAVAAGIAAGYQPVELG